MENTTLNKIWSFLGLASLILSVNGVLVTQGADFSISFGVQLKEQGRYTASVYGLMLSLPVYIVFLLTTHTFIYKNTEGSWVKKFPMAFNTQFSKPSLDVKIYQITFIFLFLIVSLYSTSHLYKKFLDGTAYMVKQENLQRLNEPKAITNSRLDHLFNKHWGLLNERYKYMCKPKGKDKCSGEMSYFPVIQPWFMGSLLILCYLLVINVFLALFTNKHITKALYLSSVNKSNKSSKKDALMRTSS